MKKILALMISLLTLLISINAAAYDVPPMPTDGFLLDQAGVLSSSDAGKIRSKLSQINTSTQNEVGVLVVNSLGGDSVEDVAYRVFNTWGIGKKGKDNGVLLLIAIQDRKMRIETGKGVGGELTDVQSNKILTEKIRPHLKKKAYADGILAGVDAIASSLDTRGNKSSHSAAPSNSADAEEAGKVVFWIVVIAVILIFLLVLYVARNGRGGGGGYGGSWSSGGGSWSSGGGSSSSSSFGGGSSGGGGSSSDW